MLKNFTTYSNVFAWFLNRNIQPEFNIQEQINIGNSLKTKNTSLNEKNNNTNKYRTQIYSVHFD